MQLLYVDLFCGAGGTSTGVESARINEDQCGKVIVCVNHDPNAIASHAANHPEALHFTEDIRTLNLAPLVEHVNVMRMRFPNAKLVLWASLECTNFSKAKGGQSRDADSRTLAEHLFRYISAIQPDYIQIENVAEFMTWGPLVMKVVKTSDGAEYCPCNVEKEKMPTKRGEEKRFLWHLSPQMIPDLETKGIFYHRWVEKVKEYGYAFDHRLLNSADYGARTSRIRFFGIFAKGDLPIVWPNPTHSKNGSGNSKNRLEKWLPVKDVLELDDEGESIFDRKKPLSPKTLERHKAGLIKFVCGGKEQYLLKYNSMSQQGKYVAPDIDAPCPVVSCQNRLGVANVQFVSKYFSGHPESKNISIYGPAHTIKTKDNHALVTADFLSAYYGTGDNVRSIDMPCPTVTTKDRFNYVSPKFLFSYSFKDAGKSLQTPCPTLLTKDRLALVSCNFLDMQYGNSRCASIDRPAGSVVGNPKHCLVTANRWLMNTNFQNIGSSIDKPAPVITANRKWHYLVNPQYNCAGSSIENPCFTLIARMDKRPPMIAVCDTKPGKKIPSFVKITPMGIVYEIYEDDLPVVKEIKEIMAIYGIIDIKQRMLKIPELKQIMGFSRGYKLVGTQADQKKFIGNAVEVNMARCLCEALAKQLVQERVSLRELVA